MKGKAVGSLRAWVLLQVAPLVYWVTLARWRPAPSLSLLICGTGITVPAFVVAMAKKEGMAGEGSWHTMWFLQRSRVLTKQIIEDA